MFVTHAIICIILGAYTYALLQLIWSHVCSIYVNLRVQCDQVRLLMHGGRFETELKKVQNKGAQELAAGQVGPQHLLYRCCGLKL